MRFAGSRIEGFLNADRPDFGKMAQDADTMRSQESNAMTDIQAKIGATGIGEAGKVEAAGIMADARAQAAQSQAQGSMFSSLGNIGSSLIGGIGKPKSSKPKISGGQAYDSGFSMGSSLAGLL